MTCHVSVLFAEGQRIDYEVQDAEISRFSHEEAKDWLGREFEAAGCVPSNPVGKLLLADRIIGLANVQPKRNFDPPSPWMKDYLAATAAALNCPVVTIDLGSHTLGY
jgi:hypothetical protein